MPFRRWTSTDHQSRGHWQLLRFGGGAALVATGAIHLDLYVTGYRTIPTIGWLFLLQVISAFALAIGVVVTPLRLTTGAGGGLLLSTLVGYLISLHVNLFGFREVRTTAGIVAGVIEIIGFTALAEFTFRPDRRGGSWARDPRTVRSQRTVLNVGRWLTGLIAVGSAIAFVVLLPNAAATTSSGSTSAVINVARVHGTSVLVNKHGDTLYWFKPDTTTQSHCYDTCAAYWPPLLGEPSPKAGLTGAFGTIKRSNGADQVTYNGHPLYTYVGDGAPGQNSGNDIRLNGGWWYEMKASS